MSPAVICNLPPLPSLKLTVRTWKNGNLPQFHQSIHTIQSEHCKSSHLAKANLSHQSMMVSTNQFFFPQTHWFHGLNLWAKELSTNTCDVGLTSTRDPKLPPLETIKPSPHGWPMDFFLGKKSPTKGRIWGIFLGIIQQNRYHLAPGFPPEIQQNRDHLPTPPFSQEKFQGGRYAAWDLSSQAKSIHKVRSRLDLV